VHRPFGEFSFPIPSGVLWGSPEQAPTMYQSHRSVGSRVLPSVLRM
jgi:hypothetical protein